MECLRCEILCRDIPQPLRWLGEGPLRRAFERSTSPTAQIRPPEQDYAPVVSSHEDPLSVADGFGGADGDVEREWPWVDVLPECDRRLFAEEMSQLMAEAAETDDLGPVEQALREWRVTAEIYLDPELLKRLTGPRLAYGERVPRPVV